MQESPNLSWMDEKIDRMEKSGRIYRLVCFFLHRKLSYKEFYMILVGLNRRKVGEKVAKKIAFARVIEAYRYLHDGNLPEGV